MRDLPAFSTIAPKCLAENGGFEPPIELSPYNGLANRRLQPLGQLSVSVLRDALFLAETIIA
jgi:hypothetical protein